MALSVSVIDSLRTSSALSHFLSLLVESYSVTLLPSLNLEHRMMPDSNSPLHPRTLVSWITVVQF